MHVDSRPREYTNTGEFLCRECGKNGTWYHGTKYVVVRASVLFSVFYYNCDDDDDNDNDDGDANNDTIPL